MTVPGLNAIVVIPDSIEGTFYPVLSDTARLHKLVISEYATLIIDPAGVVLIDATAADSTLVVVEGMLLDYGFIGIVDPGYRAILIGEDGEMSVYGEIEICGSVEAIRNEGMLEITATGLLEL